MTGKVTPKRLPKPRTMLGWDGTDFFAIRVDDDGHLQIDILTIPLPTDAATDTALKAVRDRIGALTSPAAGSVNKYLEQCLIRLGLIDNLPAALRTVGADALIAAGTDHVGAHHDLLIDPSGRSVTKDWVQRLISEGYGFTTEFLNVNQADGADTWHRIINPAASGRDIKLVGVYVYVDGGAGRFEVWRAGTQTDGASIGSVNLRMGDSRAMIAELRQNDTNVASAGSVMAYGFDPVAWIPLYYEIYEDNFWRFRIVNSCGAVSNTHIYPIWVEF